MPDENVQFLGALIDDRPEVEKQKDFFQNELVASATPVTWIEKPKEKWRKFTEQNQNGSGSCVAQTIKKLGQVMLYLKEGVMVEFSATPIYQSRSNRPAGGMIGVEAFDLWMKHGLTLEALVKSREMTDTEMDSLKIEQYEKDIAAVFKIGGHVGITNGDFERVASTIQTTGKAVMVWFYFKSSEWGREIPVVLDPSLNLYGASTARHSVAAIDFFLWKGKKYLLVEDSAWFGNQKYHLISEEFFAARNFFCRYPMNFKFQDQTVPQPLPEPKPSYDFQKVLEFIPLNEKGEISDLAKHNAQKVDVIALQDILRYEGVFPTNVQSTGYYGATTAKAVYNYQVKHSVAPLSELDSLVPKGGRVGAKTIASLNSLY